MARKTVTMGRIIVRVGVGRKLNNMYVKKYKQDEKPYNEDEKPYDWDEKLYEYGERPCEQEEKP